METYSIAQVETLTGIQAHTLRIWEKRYGFVIPDRTDTKIRFYTDEQLKTLINVSVLLDAGYKISKLAQMQADLLLKTSLEVQSSANSDHADINGLLIAMLELDEARFEEIFQISIIRRGLFQTILTIIYPFLHRVGILWGVNKVLPAQEHFVSQLIKKKIYVSIDALSEPKENAPRAVLFLPEREEHEIGLLLANYIFKNSGWKTYYLGPNVPVENVASVEQKTRANLLFTMFISPYSGQQKSFENIMAQTKTKLLVTGNPDLIPLDQEEVNHKYLRDPNELISFIRNYN